MAGLFLQARRCYSSAYFPVQIMKCFFSTIAEALQCVTQFLSEISFGQSLIDLLTLLFVS